MLTIFNKNGQMRTAIEPSDNSTQTKEVQGENLLNLSFTHYEHIPLDVLDYVDFEGERYWLLEKYAPKQINSQEWSYDLKMYGADSLIKRFLVLETTDGNAEPIFTLTATPREHAQMVLNCINAGMGNSTPWQLGQVDGENLIVIDYNGTYCNEALTKIVEAVGGKTEWWFDAQTLNICRCESGDEITLAYGNGLTELERDTSNIAKFYTRLFPIGSDRNIDPEKYGYFRLMLPEKRKYVEIQTEEYGVFDHFERETFADIYPRRIGTISEVRSEDVSDENGTPFTIYYFKDDSLDFDPNQHELPNETKRISFQDGDLAGMGETDDHYFECNYNSDTREFELITIWPYDSDTQLPGGNIIPRVGDHYILWNITMPDEYYTLAEQELQQAVNQYNDEHWFDLSVYKGTTDHVWMELGGKNLFLGRRVRLESLKYFPETGFRNSRITKITRKVNLPLQMDIEISDAVHTGTLEQLNGSLSKMEEEVASNGKKAEQYKKEAQDFTVRRFRDTQETIRLLEKAMLANFTSSVSPLSVHTMAALVGDESLQFRFIDNSGNTVLCNIAYSNTTHQLTAPKSILQHLTLGIDTITSDRQSEEYKTWNLEAYTSPAIISETDTDKAFYLYAKVSKTENTGTYLLTDKAVAMEEAVGSYHLLIGILNSEYNGERSFVTLYGFTEILPGRITTDKIVSGDGKTYFDLANSEIGGNIKFKSTSGEYKGIEEGITESIENLEIGGNNLILNSRCDKEIPALSTTGGYSVAYSGGRIGLGISDEVLYNGNPTLKLFVGTYNGEPADTSQRYIQFDRNLRTDNKLEQSDYIASCMVYIPNDYPDSYVSGGNTFYSKDRIVLWGFNGSSYKYYECYVDWTKKGQWQKLTVYLPYERDTTQDWCFFRMADKNYISVAGKPELNRIYISEIQFVKGNKETAWKPAPEDAQNELKDAIAAEEEARNAALADVSKEMAGLQDQIDGKIESFFENYNPSTINEPARTWLEEGSEDEHLNDTFTNMVTGESWKWSILPEVGTYGWKLLGDNGLSAALNKAGEALSTADGKSTTYLSKPTSYSKGDLWILESDTVHSPNKAGEILTANKTSSSYAASDWSKKVRYTDDTAALLAQQNAEAAANAAKKAQTDANSANALLSDIANDNKLTPQEKQQAKKEWDAIVAEEPLNEASAKNYGINTTKYTDAYNKLESYLKPLLENLANTSDIKGSDFRNVFNVYYTERTNLLNAISSKAKQLADNAQTKADAANTLATQAKSAATSAQSAIDAMNNDSIFDVTEKQSIRTEWECISGNANTTSTIGGDNGSYKKACLMAESVGLLHETLDTQFSSLRTYLSSVQLYTDSNYGDDAGENQFSRTTLATNFANYYNAETALIAEVQKKIVDDVEIGGTNLFPFFRFTKNLSCTRGTVNSSSNYALNITATSYDCYTNTYVGAGTPIKIEVSENKQYFLSFKKKFNTAGYILLRCYNSEDSQIFQYYSSPANNQYILNTPTGTKYICIRFGITNSGETEEFYDIMLEQGNKPTAWSPSPEDVKEYTDKTIDEIEIGAKNLIPFQYLLDWNKQVSGTTNKVSDADGDAYQVNFGSLFSISDKYASDVFGGKIKYKEKQQYAFKIRWKFAGTSDDTKFTKACFYFYYKDAPSERLVLARITKDDDEGVRENIFISEKGRTIDRIVGDATTASGDYSKTNIYNILLVEGNKVPSGWIDAVEDVEAKISELDYLKEALQGTTEIDGGLVLTNVIQLKNAAGTVTGGMNGLNDSRKNVFLWGGGTLAQALAENVITLIRRDGSGFFAGKKMQWGTDGSFKVGIFEVTDDSVIINANDNSGRQIVITNRSLSEAIALQQTINSSITRKSVDYFNKQSYTASSSIQSDKSVSISVGGMYSISEITDLIEYNTEVSVIGVDEAGYDIDGDVSSRVEVESITSKVQFIQSGSVLKEISLASITNKETYVECAGGYNSTKSNSGFGTVDFGGTTLSLKAGTLTVRVIVQYTAYLYKDNYTSQPDSVSTNYLNVQINANGFTLKGIDRCTVIGNDGVAVIVNSDSHFYVYNSGNNLDVRMKGLPTSKSNISGQIWKSGEYIKIVP